MKLSTLDMETSPEVKLWAELCADRALADLPYKIETTRSGKLIMSPASIWHSDYQTEISFLLRQLMYPGKVWVECAIKTSNGVKAADVTWMSLERTEPYREAVCLPIAPEICVEVASPSNTRKEFEEKRRLYFEAGASEVWFCDKNGRMTFYSSQDKGKALAHSLLCPEFPAKVEW